MMPLTTNKHLVPSVQGAEAEKLLKRRNPRALGRALLSAAGDGLCRWCCPVCSWGWFVQAMLRESHSSVKHSWFSHLLQMASQLIRPGIKNLSALGSELLSTCTDQSLKPMGHSNPPWDPLLQTSFDWPSTWATAPWPRPPGLLLMILL
jgi:hypothetical protein